MAITWWVDDLTISQLSHARTCTHLVVRLMRDTVVNLWVCKSRYYSGMQQVMVSWSLCKLVAISCGFSDINSSAG